MFNNQKAGAEHLPVGFTGNKYTVPASEISILSPFYNSRSSSVLSFS